MILGVELALLIYGIVVLSKGEFSLGSGRKVTGGYARALGAICLAPLPLAFLFGFTYGYMQGMQGGELNTTAITLVELGLVALAVILLVVLSKYFHAKQQREQASSEFTNQYAASPEDPNDPRNAPPGFGRC